MFVRGRSGNSRPSGEDGHDGRRPSVIIDAREALSKNLAPPSGTVSRGGPVGRRGALIRPSPVTGEPSSHHQGREPASRRLPFAASGASSRSSRSSSCSPACSRRDAAAARRRGRCHRRRSCPLAPPGSRPPAGPRQARRRSRWHHPWLVLGHQLPARATAHTFTVPGRAGVEPRLAVTYDGSGNGVLGSGFHCRSPGSPRSRAAHRTSRRTARSARSSTMPRTSFPGQQAPRRRRAGLGDHRVPHVPRQQHQDPRPPAHARRPARGGHLRPERSPPPASSSSTDNADGGKPLTPSSARRRGWQQGPRRPRQRHDLRLLLHAGRRLRPRWRSTRSTTPGFEALPYSLFSSRCTVTFIYRPGPGRPPHYSRRAAAELRLEGRHAQPRQLAGPALRVQVRARANHEPHAHRPAMESAAPTICKPPRGSSIRAAGPASEAGHEYRAHVQGRARCCPTSTAPSAAFADGQGHGTRRASGRDGRGSGNRCQPALAGTGLRPVRPARYAPR